jgi:hypothetical protein
MTAKRVNYKGNKMKLYIQYIDGKIEGHPILEENLRQVNPQFDPANLPNTLKVFERVQAPISGPYVRIESIYQLQSDDVVRDVHTEIGYTEEERAARIAQAMGFSHPNGWVFNETLCVWEPPSPPPDDGKKYIWSNDLESWQELVI